MHMRLYVRCLGQPAGHKLSNQLVPHVRDGYSHAHHKPSPLPALPERQWRRSRRTPRRRQMPQHGRIFPLGCIGDGGAGRLGQPPALCRYRRLCELRNGLSERRPRRSPDLHYQRKCGSGGLRRTRKRSRERTRRNSFPRPERLGCTQPQRKHVGGPVEQHRARKHEQQPRRPRICQPHAFRQLRRSGDLDFRRSTQGADMSAGRLSVAWIRNVTWPA